MRGSSYNIKDGILALNCTSNLYVLGFILAMSASEVQSSLQTWIDQAEALASKGCRSDDRNFLPEIKVTVSVLTLPVNSDIL